MPPIRSIALDGLRERRWRGKRGFQGAWDVDGEVVTEVPQRIRTKLIRHARARGFLAVHEAERRFTWAHGRGFSLDASVIIPAHDRKRFKRLIVG